MDVAVAIWQTENHSDGGVESMTQIIERMHRVHPIVVTQLETPRTARWRAHGLEVHVLPAYENWSEDPLGVRHLPGINAWIAALARRRRLRVVHLNDIRAFLNLAVGARAGGARIVLNVRGVMPANRPYNAKWRIAATVSDHIIALSNEMARDLAQRMRGFIRQAPISYFYSVVDLARMSVPSPVERATLRAKLDLPSERLVLPYVAAFNETKAQLKFLERTMPELAARVPSALVCFVGDFRPENDDYARRCADVVAAHCLEDHVRFVGFTPCVADWYGAADAIVLASRSEGLARCMIEGIARGAPVVSFDVCSAREILDEHRCGLVVPQGEYRGLVNAIEQLAASPSLRTEMGARGARVARELFVPERVVSRYEDLYLAVGGR